MRTMPFWFVTEIAGAVDVGGASGGADGRATGAGSSARLVVSAGGAAGGGTTGRGAAVRVTASVGRGGFTRGAAGGVTTC